MLTVLEIKKLAVTGLADHQAGYWSWKALDLICFIILLIASSFNITEAI
jgi:hypothetical protein